MLMNLRRIQDNLDTEGNNVCKHDDLLFKKAQKLNSTTEVYIYKCKDCGKKIRKNVKVDEEINPFTAMRSNVECDHDWIEDGRDSHYFYYKCSKCPSTCRM